MFEKHVCLRMRFLNYSVPKHQEPFFKNKTKKRASVQHFGLNALRQQIKDNKMKKALASLCKFVDTDFV